MINVTFHMDRDACTCHTPDVSIVVTFTGESEPRTLSGHVPEHSTSLRITPQDRVLGTCTCGAWTGPERDLIGEAAEDCDAHEQANRLGSTAGADR